jgi:hypothetical protein
MTPGIKSNLPSDIRKNYSVFELHHASSILAHEFSAELEELIVALRKFRFKKPEIMKGGGSESAIPKTMSALLRPNGWAARKHNVSLSVDGKPVQSESHWIDYVKGRVAFDLEWNSKDQTFDRDLYAFRAFFEYDKISVGVLLTRDPDLADLFKELGIQAKYGASTTHWGKLLPRLQSGRGGGCPILALGISRALYLED